MNHQRSHIPVEDWGACLKAAREILDRWQPQPRVKWWRRRRMRKRLRKEMQSRYERIGW